MRRGTWTQIAAVGVMAACLTASGAVAVSLSAMAGRSKLVYTDRAEDATSPEVAAGIAMGMFRGLFVNYLWIRANNMKEAGKFFDAIQLADAITRLQPRFPRVWVFHAWNMAYNISVQTQTAAERWDWVNQGISLLRDRGIRANPNDLLLHRELAWIFLHKIGGYTDDANPYYKRRLAAEWTIVLGPPPLPNAQTWRDREKAIESYVQWLTPIARAPGSLAEVVKQRPGVASLVNELNALNVRPTRDDLLTRVELLRALNRSGQQVLIRERLNMGPNTLALERLVMDPARREDWDAYLAHVRGNILREQYNMEPERMIRYTRKFGPLDWRHHGAHALYWSARGVEQNLTRFTKENRTDFDFINTDRITVQAVQDLFRSGELYFDFLTAMAGGVPLWQGVPNPHFVDSYTNMLDEVRSRSWADRLDNRGFSPLSGGYENFLRDVIAYFFRRNDMVNAERYYSKLRLFGGMNLNNPDRADEMSKPLLEFVQNDLKDRAGSPSVAINQISAAIIGAYTSGLLAGDRALFDSQFRFAREFHRFFFEEQGRITNVNRAQFRMEQLDRDFRIVAGTLFFQFMAGLGLDDAERVYAMAPNDLRQFAYDALDQAYRAVLDDAAKRGGRPFDVVFPEPSGMPEFRRMMEEMQQRRIEGQADLEKR